MIGVMALLDLIQKSKKTAVHSVLVLPEMAGLKGSHP